METERIPAHIAVSAQNYLSGISNEYRIRVERPLPLTTHAALYQLKLMIPSLRMHSLFLASIGPENPGYELPYDNSEGRVPESASVFLVRYERIGGGIERRIGIEIEWYDWREGLLQYLEGEGIVLTRVTDRKKTGDFNYQLLRFPPYRGFITTQHGSYKEEEIPDGIENAKRVIRLVCSTCEIPPSDPVWTGRVGITGTLVDVGDEMRTLLASIDTLPDDKFVVEVNNILQFMDARRKEVQTALTELTRLQKLLNIN